MKSNKSLDDITQQTADQLAIYTPRIAYKVLLENCIVTSGYMAGVQHIIVRDMVNKSLKEMGGGSSIRGYTFDQIYDIIKETEKDKDKKEKTTEKEVKDSLNYLKKAEIIEKYDVEEGPLKQLITKYYLHRNIRENRQALYGFELYFTEEDAEFARRKRRFS